MAHVNTREAAIVKTEARGCISGLLALGSRVNFAVEIKESAESDWPLTAMAVTYITP